MACFHPAPAWRARRLNENGKRPLTFSLADGFADLQVDVPCGRCIDCLKRRAREWALRCEHEARLHEHNWFVTLTYEDSNLPPGNSLRPADLQKFWKRVRKAGFTPRYYACGEYGETTQRPHYHAVCFGLHLPDARRLLALSGDRSPWVSDQLTALWGLGQVHFGPFEPAAAAYVAGYVEKKLGAPQLAGRVPEFQVMSRRPGLGAEWLLRFNQDVYPGGVVTSRGGAVARSPRFYDNKQEILDRPSLLAAKRKRALHARPRDQARNAAQEDYATLKVTFYKNLKRNKI